MSTQGDPGSVEAPPPTREELVALVARAHQGAPYAECTLAGRALAMQSKLPKVIAENLGAGFGQWDFFPDAVAIVDFALGYAPPATEDDLWALVRTWASDDAANRPTLMALVGREIASHELRRVDVPKLRELLNETRSAQARALRASLGLDVPAAAPAKAPRKARAPSAPKAGALPRVELPSKMPKPALGRLPKAPPPPPPRRFEHAKFGEGVLEREEGAGPDAKLTIKFPGGTKTLLARFVRELP